MKRIPSIIVSSFILCIISCKSTQDQSEKWEGFSGDKMRVVISEFFIPDEKNPTAIPEQLIRERVIQRASLLLASYVNITLQRDKVSPESDSLFNRLIGESLSSPVTVFSECLENNYCTVITEFDITSVNRELKK